MTAKCLVRDVQLSNALSELQEQEQHRLRVALMTDVREGQKIACGAAFSYLLLKLGSYEEATKLSCILSGNLEIHERMIEMARLNTFRGPANRLIQAVYGVGNAALAKLFSSIDSDLFEETYSFLPAGLSASDYFSVITLPALFGYLWSSECESAFVQFLVDCTAGKSVQDFLSGWICEAFTAYMALRLARIFGSQFAGQILVVARSGIRPDQPTAEIAHKLGKSAVELLESRLLAVPILVRTFFDGAFPDCPDKVFSKVIWRYVCRCVREPKSQGLLPATHMPQWVQSLAELSHQLEKTMTLYQESLSRVYFALPRQASIQPSLQEFMELTGTWHVPIMIGVTDVVLLATLLVPVGAPDSLRKIASEVISCKISTPDLRWFRYECWELEFFGLTSPTMASGGFPSTLAESFVKLCRVVNEDFEGDSVGVLLTQICRLAESRHDFRIQSVLAELVRKCSDKAAIEHFSDVRPLLSTLDLHRLEAQVRLRVSCEQASQRVDGELIAKMRRVVRDLEGWRILFKARADLGTHFLACEFVRRFLEQSDLRLVIPSRRVELARSKRCWLKFWQDLLGAFRQYVVSHPRPGEGDDIQFRRLLHSWALQSLPFRQFVQAHGRWKKTEDRVNSAFPRREGGDSSASEELRAASMVELPVEAVERIGRAIVSIEALGGDGVARLSQALGQVNHVYCFAKYLEFYLGGIADSLMDADHLKALDVFLDATYRVYEAGGD